MDSIESPHRYWLLSFCRLAAISIFLWAALLGTTILLGKLWYVEQFELWSTLSGDEYKQLMRVSPEAILPRTLAIWVLIFNAIWSLLGGFAMVWWASPRRCFQGLILAAVTFLSFFQTVIADESPLPKWIGLSLMVSGPLAILAGGWFAERLGGGE